MRYWITATLFLLAALIYAANHLGFVASSFANIRGTEIETIALKWSEILVNGAAL